MNHSEIRSKLSDFYDGEVSPAERQEIQAHLAECQDCQADLAQFSKFSSTFFTPHLPPSPFFVRGVMSRINRRTARVPAALESSPAGFSRWIFPGFVTACAASFLLLMTYPLQPSVPEAESPLVSYSAETRPGAWLTSSEAPDDEEIVTYLLEEA